MSEIQEILTRFWDQLIAHPSGPLAFRLILQPIMATILAILDGSKDARVGRSPYLWTILSDPSQRAGYLREGLNRVSRVIVFALVMDAIYQFMVLGRFYLGEALVNAFVLAVLPYLLIRGPVARIARPPRRATGGELRRVRSRAQDPAQGDERRLVPVRAELLSSLSPRRADGAQLDVPSRVPLRRASAGEFEFERAAISGMTLRSYI